jgi:NAD(P)-dependent dehydrogenase (short-subunit alcohol dehydrogenase family)
MIPPFSKTEDGFESQMGVNFFGHFLLTGLLYNLITGTPGSRVVTLSSNAHKKGKIKFDDLNWEKRYSPLGAYRQSKLACLMFAYELQRRFANDGLPTISVAAHPGLSLTDLVRNIPKWLLYISQPLTSEITHSPELGAQPVIMAALDPDVKGGDYYGPDGRSEWTGEPVKVRSTQLSHDKIIARRLWVTAERLTGFKYS